MNRTVPLILAVALFMENMDSTVIATSLPAIATDIGTSPIALKLALTAYLVSLAIFIPISGWMADRFGAKTHVPLGDRGVHPRSVACAMSRTRSLAFVLARFVQGIGGAMMTPVARLVLVRATPKRELVSAHGLADHPGAGRAAGRPAGRRLHHHLLHLALDLPDQCADRHPRHLLATQLPARNARRPGRGRSTLPGFLLSAIAASGVVFGLSVVSLPALPPIVGVATLALGLAVGRRLCPPRAPRRQPDPRSEALRQPDVPRCR